MRRGIYTHAGSMLYVILYHQAPQFISQESQMVRYLPQRAANLLCKYLVHIRPFTEMVRRLCFSQHRERRLLFASLYEPEKLWKTPMLTKALSDHSRRIIGIGIGVQLYRQLSIATTENQVKQISKPLTGSMIRLRMLMSKLCLLGRADIGFSSVVRHMASMLLIRTHCSRHYYVYKSSPPMTGTCS